MLWNATVERFIARENIRRFEAQLQTCTDPEQRKTLERLLEDEHRRLQTACETEADQPRAIKGNS